MVEKSPHERRPPRKVVMPPRDEIIGRLTEAELYGITQASDTIYDAFIDQVAGTRKEANGLVFAWQIAIHQGLTEAPLEDLRTLEKFFNRQFYKLAETVVPDLEAITQAKQSMENYEEYLKKKK